MDLCPRESAELRAALRFKHYDYTNFAPKDKPEIRRELKSISINHSVKQQLQVVEFQTELRRHKKDYDKPRSIIIRSQSLKQKNRVDLNRYLENKNIQPVQPAERCNSQRSSPRKPMVNIVRSQAYNDYSAPTTDPFLEFCSQIKLEKPIEPTIKVRPPPRPKNIKKKPVRRFMSKKKKQQNEDAPVLVSTPVTQQYQVYVKKSALNKDAVIDLDNTDFLDYIIETPVDE